MNSHICANAIVLDLAILEEKPTLITKSSNNEQKFIIKFGKYWTNSTESNIYIYIYIYNPQE